MYKVYRFRFSYFAYALLLIGLIFLAACADSAEPTTVPVPTPLPTATAVPSPIPTAADVSLETELTKDIVYANVNGAVSVLDISAPQEPGSWPVIIVTQGGKFERQNREFMAPFAEEMASQGAVVYNAGIYLEFPNTLNIKRLACAVRFAHASAVDYGGNPDQIVLIGGAYGGVNGVIVALAGDDFDGDECVETGESALPDVLVAYEGFYDYITTPYFGMLDHTSLKDENPDLWQEIDPYTYIGRNPDVRVRLIHGQDEDTAWWDVLPEVSVDLQQALVDAGYDATLTMVDHASHTAMGNSASEVSQIAIQQAFEALNTK